MGQEVHAAHPAPAPLPPPARGRWTKQSGNLKVGQEVHAAHPAPAPPPPPARGIWTNQSGNFKVAQKVHAAPLQQQAPQMYRWCLIPYHMYKIGCHFIKNINAYDSCAIIFVCICKFIPMPMSRSTDNAVTVSRDFLLLLFFLNQFPPSPWVYH